MNILNNLNVAFIKLNKWEQNGFMILKNESYLNNNPRLGEDIVVQVMKEPISRKGPTVTRDIILENENIKIHSYNRNNIVFGKTFNFSDKQYLRTITTLVKPKKIGIEIEKKEKKINIWEIIKNLRKLEKKSLLIEKKIRKIHNSPCLISPKQGIIEIILKKKLVQEETVIITKTKTQSLKIKEKLISSSIKKNKIYIEYCNKKISSNYYYYIEYLIKELLKPKIKLNNGGHIIIEKTEALTSIDVNSGGFNKLKSSRETILWVNLAATKEVVTQLKLRNISGIIVIDFIDMINQDDQLSLLEYLDKQLQLTLNGSKIIQISEIGLVEIVKQREERNIYDMFSQQCLVCQGLGYKRNDKLSNKLPQYFLELSSIFG